jgi:hypothetical protein
MFLLSGGSMQTQDLTLQALAERISKLEAQNRWLKLAGLAVVILASAALVMGQARSSRVVEASEFHLVDAKGKTRARLGMGVAGGPTLTFFDTKDLPIAGLDGGKEPSLFLTGWDNAAHILLRITKDSYGLDLADKRPRATLSVSNNSTGLDFWDEYGDPQATMSVDKSSGNITFRNARGKVSSQWVDSRTTGPSLVLYDKTEKAVWSAP